MLTREAVPLFWQREPAFFPSYEELQCCERWDEQSVFVEALIPRPVPSAKMLVLLYASDFAARKKTFRESLISQPLNSWTIRLSRVSKCHIIIQ